MKTAAFREPAWLEINRTSVSGHAGLRMMVILWTPGCIYAQRTGGCTNCGFWHHLTTGGVPVSAKDLVAQLQAALDAHRPELETITEVDLFCSGSLLADEEVPPAARTGLLSLCATLPALRRVVVESRPEYVTATAVEPLVSALGPFPGRLEVAIGLETADDFLRQERIRKGFTLAQFERAAGVLARLDVGLGVYLLLKPMGTGEEEAVEDVLASGRYLEGLRRKLQVELRVALEPTFVPEGTPLHREMTAGRYTPPSLWSVVRATRGLAAMGHVIHVGLSSEGMPADSVPAGCPECTHRLREALGRFNETQDVGALEITCGCRAGVA